MAAKYSHQRRNTKLALCPNNYQYLLVRKSGAVSDI